MKRRQFFRLGVATAATSILPSAASVAPAECLTFHSKGIEHMRITSNGTLSLGTSNPTLQFTQVKFTQV